MKTNEAIMAFSQSEKIKAGLIWVSQTIEFAAGMPPEQKRGAERTIQAFLNLISHEVSLARTLAKHEAWNEIESYVEKALIMIHSGVGEEAGVHISKAMSKVTNIGQQSMSLLREEQLL